MSLEELLDYINFYNKGETNRSFVVSDDSINFENDYISVIRIDTSNNWVDSEKMTKMWSVVFKQYKSIEGLETYQNLKKVLDIKVTPVHRGVNKGCYGLRIYGMTQNPSVKIIEKLLNYLFQ